MKVFLAFAFRDEDKELVGYCDQLAASQFALTATGEGLGGEQLTPAVQKKIDSCDALIGLLTRRDQLQNGKFTSHQWVHDELAYARNNNKRVIALVESQVDLGGMYASHEYIPLDRANPLPAFLRLAETIGEWKYSIGRSVKVQIFPGLLAKKVRATEDGILCAHRLYSRAGKRGVWKSVTPIPEVGGTFVLVDGVQDDDLIQLKVEGAGKKPWQSDAISQWVRIDLKEGGK